MKYIVGYQLTEGQAFVDGIIDNKEHIKEVYFSFGNFPNGRGALPNCNEYTEYERHKRQESDLKKIADAGIKFNLLFNGNCYGRESQSRELFNRIGNTVLYVGESFGLSSVTTSSPLIARFIRENFPGIDVRASVNMEIGTPFAVDYVAEIFDSFYVKRECNRDKQALTRMKEKLDSLGKRMYLLANSGCLNFCSTHTFHDNLVAHETEIAAMDNAYNFEGACRDFFKNEENRQWILARSNFIRPEDIGLYEEFTDAVKLATRVARNPIGILEWYVKGKCSSSITGLCEPDHTGSLLPYVIENSRLPKDFGKTVFECNHNCDECGYCKDAYRGALVSLS